jgi:SAM-dependent MidA family methyltransferase
MSDRLRELIADCIRSTGPISFAEFMKLSLYHPSYGYYARASRRTGRAGDFFTSVDVGPVFGELLARQFAEMSEIVLAPASRSTCFSARGTPAPPATVAAPRRSSQQPQAPPESRFFDLVEAGAGSGQLARDVLDAAARHHPELYCSVRLHLVDIAPAARALQRETLGPHASKLVSSTDSIPDSVSGVIFANELLDALPTHAVVMRKEGLREMFVALADDAAANPEFTEYEREPSTSELEQYLERAGVRLEPGWRAEINLVAPEWVRHAAGALHRGFLVLVDYGHDAAELYSATHSAGTLATVRRHTSGDRASLLQDPGEHDITAHVDLMTVTRAAEAAGLVTLGRLDQTYFLLGLGLAEMLDGPVDALRKTVDSAQGVPVNPVQSVAFDPAALKTRLALKTLMLPGGLGSTLKVLMFGKGVGTPKLRGLSYRTRLT